MALRLLRLAKNVSSGMVVTCRSSSNTIELTQKNLMNKERDKMENNLINYGDPDIFGTLSINNKSQEHKLVDEDDIKEEKYLSEIPMPSQKLTIKQYSDIIKQYISHKRILEAIKVLEVRMLTVDRVKPENYIYNILIGACADVGYTKKAFKLFNDMKRRGLKPTGDTYTCLFHACACSPWATDGLTNARNLRKLMIEKGVEPNLTIYNSMIKAFGRCGDLQTAFQIVDEMTSKNIKIRVHTFNHLLHACISDKTTGLRHALVVWRKMLKLREKPNLYSFNLMLKCVKECSLGTKSDMEELIEYLSQDIAIGTIQADTRAIESSHSLLPLPEITIINANGVESKKLVNSELVKYEINDTDDTETKKSVNSKLVEYSNDSTDVTNLGENDKYINLTKNISKQTRLVPNLLSKVINMELVLALQEVQTVQEKFAVIGGADDFLKEMETCSIKPDIKTFTQIIPLLDNTREDEDKLLAKMKSLNIKKDIDFYNNLIKKRCLRYDYDGAFELKDIIKKENEVCKKRYKYDKKLRLKFNIMTYGVIALACKSKESAIKLLEEMRENQLKINIEILGTLLKCAILQYNFDYVLYIMKAVKVENIVVNRTFLNHLETFQVKCEKKIEKAKENNVKVPEVFVKSYNFYSTFYKNWLKEMNVEDALNDEHPWQQFRNEVPETLQRSIEIKEPKRITKRNRKYVSYVTKL